MLGLQSYNLIEIMIILTDALKGMFIYIHFGDH